MSMTPIPPGYWVAMALAFSIIGVGSGSARATDYGETMAGGSIGFSARVTGMGGAQVGLGDDTSTLFYNPAGLGTAGRRQATTLYARQFGEVDHFALSLGASGLGVGGYLTRSSVEGTDEYGQPTGQSHEYSEAAIAVGGATRVFNGPMARAYGGAALRLLSQRVGDVHGSGLALDLGFLVESGPARFGLSRRGVRVGGLGLVSYSSGAQDPVDPLTTLGASLRAGDLLFAADYEFESSAGRAGVEAWLGALALRAGLAQVAGERQPSLGAGFKWGNVRADYAYLLHPVLSGSHRLSLAVTF